MDTCQNCGKPLRPGVRFCTACGFPVPLEESGAEEEGRREKSCLRCGASLPDEAVFCPACGCPAPPPPGHSPGAPEEMPAAGEDTYSCETDAIDDALESKLAEELREPEQPFRPAWEEELEPPSRPTREEEPERIEAEVVAEGPDGGPGGPWDRDFSAFREVEPRRAPGQRPRRKKLPLTLTPAVRKRLVIVLVALAVVLALLVAALLLEGGRQPDGEAAAASASSESSQPETTPVEVPGPGEVSALKTVLAQAIEPQFLEADQFQENGLARVRTADGWEIIDRQGMFISREAYEEVGFFSDGYCWVKKDGKYAFMAEDGTLLGDNWYPSVLPFSEGLALVETSDGRYVYIDIQGDVAVIPAESCKTLGSFSGGLARVVEKDGRVAYITTDGSIAHISQGRFADGKTFDPETGLCPVTDGDGSGWYYITSDGSAAGSSGNAMSGFDSASIFEDGVAIVSRDGKMAHLRSDGVFLTQFEYDQVWGFSDGYATVRVGDKYGYVDTSGQLVIPVVLEDVWSFGDGLVPVKLTDDWGYLNSAGETVIKAQWDECYKFYDGVAKYREEGHYGYLNTQGDLLCPPQYQAGGYCTAGMIPVQFSDGLWGYLAVS